MGVIYGPIARAATLNFAAKQDFATGTNPRAVAVGDLNGDGRLDLAVANISSNSVSVLLNTSLAGGTTSTFAAKKDFATGAEPVSVAVSDVNGDGKLDLVVANSGANSVSILLNTTVTGALTPTFAVKQDFGTNEGPLFVAIGDLNGDGKLDVAVVDHVSNTLSVLLNTTVPGAAAANFAAHQEFVTDLGPEAVQMGDLNGDGKLDLAIANLNSGTVSVLVNTTDGGANHVSFAGIQEIEVADSPTFVSLGDLNRDGRLDLVVSNSDSAMVTVRLNTTTVGATTLTFSDNQQFATPTGLAPVSIAVVDLDGDGRLDLATANRNSDSVSLLLNTTAPGDTIATFADKLDFTTDAAPVFIQAGDLNNDGKLDLVVTNINGNSVSVLLNTTDQGTATPGFAVKQDVETGSNPRSVSVGDLNGDGKDDLAVANVGSDSVSVLLNTAAPGAATASFTNKHDFATGIDPVSLAMLDVNLDGKLDLAVVNTNSDSVSVLVNTTIPGAVTPNFARQDFSAGVAPLFVAVGDLNNDGKPDLVVADTIVAVSVLLNTTVPGAVTPTFAPKVNVPVGDGPRSVSLTDINGDGRLDLAVVDFNIDNVSVLLNTTIPGAGIPTFSEIAFFPTAFRPVSIVSGDLNNDGRQDLAVVNVNGNNVSMLLNTTVPGASVPNFAAKQDFDTGFNPRAVIATDLNGDGKLDLGVAKSGANSVAVLVNTTTPGAAVLSFAPKRDFAAGNNSLFVASGDLNSDGKPDLVTTNFDSDTVSVLLNTVTMVTATGLSVQEGSAPSKLQIARVTNYGGDGTVAVKIISDNPSDGVTISNVINTDGIITADVVASVGASDTNFILQARDASSTVSDTLKISVTANAPPTPTPTPTPLTIQFSAATYEVGEGEGHVHITLTRSGDNSRAATVDFRTTDTDTFTVGCADTVNNRGSAFGRCDFATTVGTLSFGSGEPTTGLDIPITDDSYAEGNETFNVVLSNATGATLGSPSTATVTIADNDTVNGPNPILQTDNAGIAFFVRQQYLDVLGREPEVGEPWSAILRNCPDQLNTDAANPSAACDRITVSGAFFGSPEFKDKGVFVIDFYRVAFNRLPEYSEFVLDLQSLVGTTAPEVFARRAAFANNFVQRPEFAGTSTLSNADYVTRLMAGSLGQNYNLTSITTSDPNNPDGTGKVTLTTNDLINRLNANTLTKAQVLRAIVQSNQITNIEAVNAFVGSQYYSYLRRTPDTAGFNSWTSFLATHPDEFRTMVNGFLNSSEYRLRFGPP